MHGQRMLVRRLYWRARRGKTQKSIYKFLGMPLPHTEKWWVKAAMFPIKVLAYGAVILAYSLIILFWLAVIAFVLALAIVLI